MDNVCAVPLIEGRGFINTTTLTSINNGSIIFGYIAYMLETVSPIMWLLYMWLLYAGCIYHHVVRNSRLKSAMESIHFFTVHYNMVNGHAGTWGHTSGSCN